MQPDRASIVSDMTKIQQELMQVQHKISAEVLSSDSQSLQRSSQQFSILLDQASEQMRPPTPVSMTEQVKQPVPRRIASLASSSDLASLVTPKQLLPQQAQIVCEESKSKRMEEIFALGCRKFSLSARQGLQYLEQNDFFPMQPPSSHAVAKFLWDGQRLAMISKSSIGTYLSAPENQSMLSQYVKLVNFYDSNKNLKSLLDSLRTLLKTFQLPGESQQIDRVVTEFSVRYSDLANRSADTPLQRLFCDSDTTYLVAFSLILLNTDLHNVQNKRKMTKKTFIDINSRLLMKDSASEADSEEDQLVHDHLEACYESIYHQPLKVSGSDQEEEFPLFMLSQQNGYLNVTNGIITAKKFCFISSGCMFYYVNRRSDDAYVMIPLVNCSIRVIPFSEHSWFTRFKERLFNYRIYSFEIYNDSKLRAVRIMPGKQAQLLQDVRFEFQALTLEDRQQWIQSLVQSSSTFRTK